MDVRAVAAGYSLRYAVRLEHATLPRYAVLCAKVIAGAWLVTGQVVYTGSTLVPFRVASALGVEDSAFVQHGALLLQLVAILTILCSRFVRAGCALLAAAISTLALLDQPTFSNNRAFCAAVLAMLALGERGALARYQVALVYACAAADKLLDADWRSGRFLQALARDLCEVGALGTLTGERAALPLTCSLSRSLDASIALAALLSSVVIALELGLAASYVRAWRGAIPLACVLHGAILIVTGSTFGMFFYACLATSVLVLDQARVPRT